MNLLEPHSGLRIISLSSTSLLCVLLVALMAQKGSSNGLLKTKPSVVLQARTFLCDGDDHDLWGLYRPLVVSNACRRLLRPGKGRDACSMRREDHALLRSGQV